MADSGGLQLLSDTRKRIDINIPGKNRATFVAVGFVVLILLLYLGLLIYQKSIERSAKVVDQDITNLDSSRDKQGEQKLLDFKKQAAGIAPILDSRFISSKALTRLQKLAEPRVQFSTLNADLNKSQFSITGVADSYASVAKQVASFYKDPNIGNILVNKLGSLPTGKIEFTMTIDVDQVKFLKAN